MGNITKKKELGTCKRYGPSYRMYNNLSNEAQVCSGRSKDEEEVLNDTWVSVPVGSEDGFKASRKNQYEEILFKCEDDRYELDMVIEVNSSTIMALMPIIKQIQDSTPEQLKSFKLEDGLDILHLRAIERIYGEKGSLVLQGINKNPVVAVPIVLKRLQQKDQEWRIARNQWNNIWKEVNEKNYFKSLDYQSMYFKQKEKKTLNPRELLAEIKKDKFQTSEGNHIFQFRMDYPNIFKDIEELIEFQANKMSLTHQDSEKLKSFVHDFIKQFFKLSQQANLHQAHSNASQPPLLPATSLFFGNNSFYVFFRFYQMLYSRLAEAIQMSFTVFQEQQQKVNTNQPSTVPTNSISLYSYPSILSSDSNNKLKQKFKSPYEIYEFYMKELLHPLISADVDPVKYEDECRDLFGISSYILFTMDRLLQALVKQIQSIFLEEISVKLISLHSYEASRSKDYFESIYYSNASSLINEESCFKFKFILSENGGEFTIQLIDSTSAQQPAIMELSMPKEPVISMAVPSNSNTSSSGSNLNSMNINNISNPNNKPKSMVGSNAEPPSSSTSSNSIPSSSLPNTSNQASQSNQVPDVQQETIDVRKHNVFLLRNQASSVRNSARNANKKVIANSGLECKICMSTFRLFYVEETEDYFYRVGQLTRARNSRYPAKRKERLTKWINSRLSDR